jgi:hypothetical protein
MTENRHLRNVIGPLPGGPSPLLALLCGILVLFMPGLALFPGARTANLTAVAKNRPNRPTDD